MSNKTNLCYSNLTDEEIANPVQFINSFCSLEYSLNEFRNEVVDMIKSACAPNKFGDSENYFFNYRCLLKLLEVGHILHEREESFSLLSNQLSHCLDTKRLSAYYDVLVKTDFRTLSPQERDNTQLFFTDFFNFQSIDEWRLTFSRFAEYAYRRSTIDEVIEDGSIMVMLREYTEKLIEVIYLIHHSETMECGDLSVPDVES